MYIVHTGYEDTIGYDGTELQPRWLCKTSEKEFTRGREDFRSHFVGQRPIFYECRPAGAR